MSDAAVSRKQEAMDEAAERYAAQSRDPGWTPTQKLALACRILAREGHGSGLAGQMTARGGPPGTMWTHPFGLGFDELRASDYMLVDDGLNVLEGDGTPNPANRFHLHVYGARPDVQAIVHTHPPHVSALSMIGEELAVSHMDTAILYEDCAFLPDWPGVPFGDGEGELIAGALGDRRAVLLAHHGQLCAGRSVEEATVLAVTIEHAARLQLLARGAGEIRPIAPDLGREARGWRSRPEQTALAFRYHARRVLRDGGDCLN